jgi:hypothetical protein
MNNTLMVYLNKRLRQNDPKFAGANQQPGPVICISREVGCGARPKEFLQKMESIE